MYSANTEHVQGITEQGYGRLRHSFYSVLMTRSLPERLARYISLSTLWKSDSVSSPGLNESIPKLQVICPTGLKYVLHIRSLSLLAKSVASCLPVPDSIRANSSPPHLAKKSVSLISEFTIPVNYTRTLSPIKCPKLSFIALKLSISNRIKESCVPYLCACFIPLRSSSSNLYLL